MNDQRLDDWQCQPIGRAAKGCFLLSLLFLALGIIPDSWLAQLPDWLGFTVSLGGFFLFLAIAAILSVVAKTMDVSSFKRRSQHDF